MRIKIILSLCFLLIGGTALSEKFLIKKERIPIEENSKYTGLCEKMPYLEKVNFYTITYLSDSLRVNGHIISPKGDGKFPGIVFNRGGNRDYGKNNLKKLIGSGLAELASKGYVVALSQYRGNGGSEGIEEFGGSDVNDVINLINTLSEVPEVDTSKIGMYGWSRGGMMTYRALVETNQIKVVVVGGGCSDLYQTLETRPEFEEKVYRELIPNYDENKEIELDKRSAIKWVSRFPKDVPILLLHGGSDGNVSPKQVLELSMNLDKYRIPYKLVIYEGDNHGLAQHREEVTYEVENWFNRFLKEGEAKPRTDYQISQ